MDPLSVLASTAQITSLCGTLINTLGRFVDESRHVDTTIESMLIEIRMLRDVSQLVHTTMRAQPLDKLDEYWGHVKILLGRCDKTLKKLNSVLTNVSARQGFGKAPIAQLRLNMKSHTVAILRRHVKSHTRALQVLLQLVNLATAAKNHGTIHDELQELKARIQEVKNSLSPERSTPQYDSPDADLSQTEIQEEETVMEDFEKFMESAEAASEIASISASTRASIRQSSPLRNDSLTQGRKNSTRTFRTEQWELDGLPLEAKLRSFQAELNLTPDSPDSDSDPDPDYEDHFPANINKRLVERFRIAAREELQAGNFNRAENSLVKMMEYLEEGERKHGIAFDRIRVHEQLAEVYYKQEKLEDAKEIYKGLIAARSDERGKSDRERNRRRLPGSPDDSEQTQEDIQRRLDECRWYYWLSKIYSLQKDWKHAARYAKRSFIGQVDLLEKEDPILFESIRLLVQIFQQQGEHIMAGSFRDMYLGDNPEAGLARKPSEATTSSRRSSFNSGIESLVSAGFDPQSPEFSPQSALEHAIAENDDRAVPAVLQTVLDSKIQKNLAIEAFGKAITYKRTEIAYLLVERIGKDSCLPDGATPLIRAVQTSHEDLVQTLLLRGADPEVRCSQGMTPLMHAVECSNESIAAILLSKKAHVDAPTWGWTPLQRAADRRLSAMVKLLLENDANTEARGPRTWSPDARLGDCSYTPLLIAARSGSSSVVRSLLEREADFDARTSTGATPLMYAAEEGHAEVVDLLVTVHAPVDAVDRAGNTALHRAVNKNCNPDVISILSSKDGIVNMGNKANETALHIAAGKAGDTGIIDILLNLRGDLEARDCAGRSPLHVAIEKRLHTHVEVLLQRGADLSAKDGRGWDAKKLAERSSSQEVRSVVKKQIRERRHAVSAMLGAANRRASEQSSSDGDRSSIGHGRSSFSTTGSTYSFLSRLG
ncbi:ankyrin repeat-containing domain protein [Phyllosticta capitalensis]